MKHGAEKVSWAQALAWRMRRHGLDPVERVPARELARRLCGVQAQVASYADLAVRARGAASGELARGLAAGELVKTWAMRGTLHVMDTRDAPGYLALLASGRFWERPRWQRDFATVTQLEQLRAAVRDVLGDRVLTREELVASVLARPGMHGLGDVLRSGWGTVLKPLAWWGELCFGEPRGARVTFRRPAWRTLPAADEAAPAVILAYVRAYGPATIDGFGAWLSRGRITKRRLRGWFEAARARLTEIDVAGTPALVATEDLGELCATRASRVVRLLPAFDPYVLGAGTDDPHVVPPAHRRDVSREAGWIAPVVLAGGVVAGTWEQGDDSTPRIASFRGAPRVPRAELTRWRGLLTGPGSIR
jgi:hypothetical protein